MALQKVALDINELDGYRHEVGHIVPGLPQCLLCDYHSGTNGYINTLDLIVLTATWRNHGSCKPQQKSQRVDIHFYHLKVKN